MKTTIGRGVAEWEGERNGEVLLSQVLPSSVPKRGEAEEEEKITLTCNIVLTN